MEHLTQVSLYMYFDGPNKRYRYWKSTKTAFKTFLLKGKEINLYFLFQAFIQKIVCTYIQFKAHFGESIF